MRHVEGSLVVGNARFCVIASRFNEAIVTRLLDGALDTLSRHGADESQIHVIRVPGAFELPLAAQEAARSRQYDAIVALGVVIRGATPHFDYVCSEAASGLARVSLEHAIPVGFGLLTCDTIKQAMERSGTKAGNKGIDAALSAIEMANLLHQLNG